MRPLPVTFIATIPFATASSDVQLKVGGCAYFAILFNFVHVLHALSCKAEALRHESFTLSKSVIVGVVDKTLCEKSIKGGERSCRMPTEALFLHSHS